MADTARMTAWAMGRLDDGAAGYTVENAFGQAIQVLPRPPAFRATFTLEWEGAMPEEVARLLERARALGIDTATHRGSRP